MTQREKVDWLNQFNITKDKFKWFFIKYGYAAEWDSLLAFHLQSDIGRMKIIMNQVWFELPDHIFNIMENPKGWSEFLALIEE